MPADLTKQTPVDPATREDLDRLIHTVKKLRRSRSHREARIREAVEFFAGNQYLDHRALKEGRVVRLPRPAPHRVRLTDNQMGAKLGTLIARLASSRPQARGVPADYEPSSFRAAEFATHLFDSAWEGDYNLQAKFVEALTWSVVADEGFIATEYDEDAGEEFEFLVDPRDNSPIVNPALEEALRQQAAARGTELPTMKLREGDFVIEPLSPLELYLIGSKYPNEAEQAIKVKGYDRDEVKKRWGKDVSPNAVSAEHSPPSVYDSDDDIDQTVVYQFYVRPCEAEPDGRLVVFTENEFLHDGDFPYDSGKLPFHRIGSEPLPGKKRDRSLGHDLVDLQKEYNKVNSQLLEHKNHIISPRFFVGAGAMIDTLTDEPGKMFRYKQALGKPEMIESPDVPSHAQSMPASFRESMDGLIGQHDASQGQTSGQVRDVGGLLLLLEQDDTRLSLRVQQMEQAIASIGSYLLALAKQFWTFERTVKAAGQGGVMVARSFRGSDLEGCEAIKVRTGSMLPRSQAAVESKLMRLIESGQLPQEMQDLALGTLDLGEVSQWMADRKLDEAKQVREIEQYALQGQPIPAPHPADNHQIAMRVLERYIKGDAWEHYDETVRQALDADWQAHQQAFQAAQPKQLPEGVRVNLQGRYDATPTERAAIDEAAGLPVDATTIAQEQSLIDEHRAHVQEAAKADNTARVAQAKAEAEGQVADQHHERQLQREHVRANNDLANKVMADAVNAKSVTPPPPDHNEAVEGPGAEQSEPAGLADEQLPVDPSQLPVDPAAMGGDPAVEPVNPDVMDESVLADPQSGQLPPELAPPADAQAPVDPTQLPVDPSQLPPDPNVGA